MGTALKIYNFEELEKWDKRFIELAKHVATWSKDPSTKVGSVIVTEDHRIASLGYNGFPRGVEDLPERLTNRDTKLIFVAHAERNALDNADSNVKGCALYVTLQPCAECTKSIIQKGIKKVVCLVNLEREEYYKQFTDYSLQMLTEAGIDVIQVSL